MKRLASLYLLLAASLAQAVPVDFTLRQEGAEVVLLAGEFNDWTPTPMQAKEAGIWQVQVEVEPGEYGYKFIVDEVWLFDPTNDTVKEVDGSTNSKLVVSTPTASSAPAKTTAAPTDTAERDWKDSITGKTIVARLIDLEGNFAVLEMNGQSFKVRKERLRPSDQAYIAEWKASRPASTVESNTTEPKQSTEPTGSPFDASLRPKQMHTFSLPMKQKVSYLWRPRSFDPKQTPENMRIAIALPDNFDPQRKDNKIAIISQTADADASSIIHMDQYYRPITSAGWVCIAVDIEGDESKRKDWSTIHDRWILAYSALQSMHEVWPASKDWGFAAFGFSGGAGYTNYIGAQLVEERYDLIGLWAGGSNWMEYHFNEKLKPKAGYYRARYFLSWGTQDQVANQGKQEQVRQWVEDKFRKFRFETYEGGHSIFQPHIEAALIWFNE